MLFNYILGIYCFECKKYLDLFTEVFLDYFYSGSISCENDHLVGNNTDKSWIDFWQKNCEYFFSYHSRGQCRCVQDNTNCNGNEEKCEYPYGRKSYEYDIKEKIK